MRLRFILRRGLCLALVCLLLAGCAPEVPPRMAPVTQPGTEATEPGPTAPPDGEPNTVSAKGSYTGTVSAEAEAAFVGEEALTGDLLQLYYGLCVSGWYKGSKTPAPDWDLPLDVQLCPLEGEAVTWQQFFLRQALEAWHLNTALVLQSAEAVMKLDPDFAPNPNDHSSQLNEDMPAWDRIYGRDPSYRLNDRNSAFIQELPLLLQRLGGSQTLAEELGGSAGALEELARQLNEAYAYFIWARWQNLEEEAPAEGDTVTFRHLLLIPDNEDWAACEARAAALLREYRSQQWVDEPRFAEMANIHSMDDGSRLDGGLYQYIAQGQLTQALDAWLFDPARTPGETALVRSDLGMHLVYYRGRESAPDRSALGAELLSKAAQQFPMTVRYEDIFLEEVPGPGTLSFRDLLYPDIAHEYITDIPVYLQQDFPTTLYNGTSLAKTGCGITTLAMLATYMADSWLTPPMLAARYPTYKSHMGTDARIFKDSAPELGYYMIGYYFNPPETQAAMAEGRVTSCLQRPGLFTRQGHYLIMAGYNPDGTISLRDSNIYNYGTVHGHADDRFTWDHLRPAGIMYWVWQDKVVRIPACDRCGGETGLTAPQGLLLSGYICGRCVDALARRSEFLSWFE